MTVSSTCTLPVTRILQVFKTTSQPLNIGRPRGKRSSIQRNLNLYGLAQTRGWIWKPPTLLEAKDSCKYLGVTISQDLYWKPHIDTTVVKGQRTLGFIRRNLRECSIEVKKTAYTTLVRPSLEYASSVWDPHTAIDSQCIKQVQRKAAKFTYNNYTDRSPGCVSNMLHERGLGALEGQKTKIKNGIVDIDACDI